MASIRRLAFALSHLLWQLLRSNSHLRCAVAKLLTGEIALSHLCVKWAILPGWARGSFLTAVQGLASDVRP